MRVALRSSFGLVIWARLAKPSEYGDASGVFDPTSLTLFETDEDGEDKEDGELYWFNSVTGELGIWNERCEVFLPVPKRTFDMYIVEEK